MDEAMVLERDSTPPLGELPYRKASIRVPQRDLVARPRLTNLIAWHRSARLVLLNAPAGYGKTALLQQCADGESDRTAIAWLTLGARDCDPMVFATHLNAALGENAVIIDEPGAGAGGSLRYYGWQAVIERIGENFAESGRQWRVLIDDAHKIADSDAAKALAALIEDAPPAVQFLVATRGEIGLPMGRIRAHYEVLELKTEELRFLKDETQSFLRARAGTEILPEQVRLLHDRSEGWIVGIKLFSMALALEPENQSILESFSGERRQIADFFVEDVFSRQPEDLQDFLLRASALDPFCASLCDEALEIEGSAELIERCESAGLFLQSLDATRTWYRFHHLFAGFLQRRLQDRAAGTSAVINRRAAHWYVAAGRFAEAVDCAIRGQDALFAAEILDSNCESMFAAGLIPTVQEQAGMLPAQILALFPRLMLMLAWRLTAQWRLSEARELVVVAKRRLDELEQSSQHSQDIGWLRLVTRHREAQLCHACYDLERLEHECVTALEESARFSTSPYLSSLYNSLQYAQREQFKLAKIDRLDALAREQVGRTGVAHGNVFVAGVTGPSLLQMGRTDKARQVLESGLELAQSVARRDDVLGAVVATSLAAVHYETNDIEKARSLLGRYLPLMTSAGLVDQLLSGWITQARLDWYDGRPDACFATLEAAFEFASRHDLERLRAGFSAEHLCFLLKAGRPDDAARFARRRGIITHRSAGLVRAQHKYTMLDSAVALSNCRLLAADDKYGEALTLARHWRSFVTAAQATLLAVKWDIAIAEILMLSGERLSAQRSLQQALAKAGPAHLVRCFLDEGEPIGGMLRQIALADNESRHTADPFLAELVAHMAPVEVPVEVENDEEDLALCGKISGREIEILTLAGTGMLNREIGRQLGLTEGTVKWYLQQVFDKVGIRNRKLVVARVRRLGLIP